MFNDLWLHSFTTSNVVIVSFEACPPCSRYCTSSLSSIGENCVRCGVLRMAELAPSVYQTEPLTTHLNNDEGCNSWTEVNFSRFRWRWSKCCWSSLFLGVLWSKAVFCPLRYPKSRRTRQLGFSLSPPVPIPLNLQKAVVARLVRDSKEKTEYYKEHSQRTG